MTIPRKADFSKNVFTFPNFSLFGKLFTFGQKIRQFGKQQKGSLVVVFGHDIVEPDTMNQCLEPPSEMTSNGNNVVLQDLMDDLCTLLYAECAQNPHNPPICHGRGVDFGRVSAVLCEHPRVIRELTPDSATDLVKQPPAFADLENQWLPELLAVLVRRFPFVPEQLTGRGSKIFRTRREEIRMHMDAASGCIDAGAELYVPRRKYARLALQSLERYVSESQSSLVNIAESYAEAIKAFKSRRRGNVLPKADEVSLIIATHLGMLLVHFCDAIGLFYAFRDIIFDNHTVVNWLLASWLLGIDGALMSRPIAEALLQMPCFTFSYGELVRLCFDAAAHEQNALVDHLLSHGIVPNLVSPVAQNGYLYSPAEQRRRAMYMYRGHERPGVEHLINQVVLMRTERVSGVDAMARTIERYCSQRVRSPQRANGIKNIHSDFFEACAFVRKLSPDVQAVYEMCQRQHQRADLGPVSPAPSEFVELALWQQTVTNLCAVPIISAGVYGLRGSHATHPIVSAPGEWRTDSTYEGVVVDPTRVYHMFASGQLLGCYSATYTMSEALTGKYRQAIGDSLQLSARKPSVAVQLFTTHPLEVKCSHILTRTRNCLKRAAARVTRFYHTRGLLQHMPSDQETMDIAQHVRL